MKPTKQSPRATARASATHTTNAVLARSPNRFRQVFNVAALKISDLLEARDLHHVLIANLPNVVGTAIGLFRIRRTDPDAEKVDGKWKILHTHVSLPVDLATGKAEFQARLQAAAG